MDFVGLLVFSTCFTGMAEVDDRDLAIIQQKVASAEVSMKEAESVDRL